MEARVHSEAFEKQIPKARPTVKRKGKPQEVTSSDYLCT
jgi:hypothetical protein